MLIRKINNYSSTTSIIPKPSYFKGVKNEPLKNLTVGNLIDEAAEKYGNREAIVSVHENRRVTFLNLKHEVRCTVYSNQLYVLLKLLIRVKNMFYVIG